MNKLMTIKGVEAHDCMLYNEFLFFVRNSKFKVHIKGNRPWSLSFRLLVGYWKHEIQYNQHSGRKSEISSVWMGGPATRDLWFRVATSEQIGDESDPIVCCSSIWRSTLFSTSVRHDLQATRLLVYESFS